MFDLLSSPVMRDAIYEEKPFARNLVCDMLDSKKRFLSRLQEYDGDRNSFSLLVADALYRQGLRVTELAEACDTAPTTITRWAKGAAPSTLARQAAVDRLRIIVDQRLGDLREQLPSNLCD